MHVYINTCIAQVRLLGRTTLTVTVVQDFLELVLLLLLRVVVDAVTDGVVAVDSLESHIAHAGYRQVHRMKTVLGTTLTK
tara:strand:- start:298 stop:537 length:240 start_codon:yes stop_codon:yes gene_type:complete